VAVAGVVCFEARIRRHEEHDTECTRGAGYARLR
jgi:hypothetical protein